MTNRKLKSLIEGSGAGFGIGITIVPGVVYMKVKRLILVYIQGITGKKTEYLSGPYGKFTKFSIETEGHFDLDAELKIWAGSEQAPVSKKSGKKVRIINFRVSWLHMF